MQGVRLDGGGSVDGQGYWWWWDTIVTTRDDRPMIIHCEGGRDVSIANVTLIDAPYYHVLLRDMVGVHIEHTSVIVHVEKQQELLTRAGHWDHVGGVPTFPLNTDGFDVAGRDVVIENVYVQNFDDAVAIKPANGHFKNAQCSSNILIRNAEVSYSVGLSIGSVPPADGHNCVNGVVFDSVIMTNAIKAMYVKTNPGTDGTGEITNVTYSNIQVKNAFWYPIWVGPQQQDQPGNNSNTGCSFFYPKVPRCPTQPLVPVKDIHFNNVTVSGALLMPGVVLCPSTVHCQGISMDNVHITGEYRLQDDWSCANADLTTNNVSPMPVCNNSATGLPRVRPPPVAFIPTK